MKTFKDDSLKNEIKNAITNRELVLYYQPLFNLATSSFEGVEALVRWCHSTKGILLPIDFVPHIEKSHLIMQLDSWALTHACQQNKAWQQKGLPPIRIAVNVSAKQIRRKNFVEIVLKTLEEAELDSRYLELELSEKILINFEDDKIIDTILRLREAGIKIALDDFGTGYTSISYLRKISIDTIKIDKSLIDNIYENRTDSGIVEALITLAMKLNINVIVEGVETLKQMQLFLHQTAIGIQGFYFSQPLPAEEVEKFLKFHQNTSSL